MKNIVYLGAFAFFAISAVTSCGDNKKGKNYNEQTKVDGDGLAFIKDAYKAGLTEIKFAKMVQGKSQNPRVLGFTKMMLTDHGAINQALKKLAVDKNVTVSDTIFEPEQQHMMDSLSKLNSTMLDKAYMQMMITDHVNDLETFDNVTRNTTKDVRDFAVKTIPVLKTHLDSAKAISASIK